MPFSKSDINATSLTKNSPTERTKETYRNSLDPIRKGHVNLIVSHIRSAERIRELETRLQQECIEKDSTVEKIQQIFDEFSKKYGLYKVEKGGNDKRLISNSDELRAALFELNEVRSTLSNLENKYFHLQKKYDKISMENEELERELDEIRSECTGSRRNSITRQSLDIDEFAERSVESEGCDDENIGLVVVEELLKKIETLKEENRNLTVILENERAEHKALQRDLHVAVKVAERSRAEAEAEVTKNISRFMESSNYLLVDSEKWANLMKKYDKTSKRNALLAWSQSHLIAYPSLSVTNFSSDWRDGKIFCALIHSIRPDLIDRQELGHSDCTQLAIKKASELGIKIDSEIFTSTTPDWKNIMAAVFELYKKCESVN